MYDLANQSFTLLINTMLFSVYFKQVVVGDPSRGDFLWGMLYAASMLLVAIASPLAGAIADFRGSKKAFLLGLGLVCVAFTCMLGLIQPGWVVVAALIYIPANFTFAVGENFLAAFLPEIAKPDQMGRVSALGWTMGYAGALILLILTAAIMHFGGLGPTASWRPLFVFAGVWFFVMAIPTALYLPERKRPEPLPPGQTLLTIGFSRLADTARHARRYKQLLIFLGVFAVYELGVHTVVAFAAIIAADFGFTEVKLALFLLQLTVTAGAAAIFTGLVQDRLGHRRTILIFLSVWAVTAIGLALIPRPVAGQPVTNEWMLWLVGNGMGFGLGGIGTSSRALVGVFTPAHKTAECFGLWGLSSRLSGVVGVAAFGAVKSISGDTVAFIMLASSFVVGFGLMFLVDEKRGRRDAREAELAVPPGSVEARDIAAAAGGKVGAGPTPSTALPDKDLPTVVERAGEEPPAQTDTH